MSVCVSVCAITHIPSNTICNAPHIYIYIYIYVCVCVCVCVCGCTCAFVSN